MRATVRWLGALACLGVAAGAASANPWYTPCLRPCPPSAPDACCGGYYVTNPYGAVYGPNYWLQPPFAPVGTVAPCFRWSCNGDGNGNGGVPGFPTHPYARSPRDFFMMEQ